MHYLHAIVIAFLALSLVTLAYAAELVPQQHPKFSLRLHRAYRRGWTPRENDPARLDTSDARLHRPSRCGKGGHGSRRLLS